MFEGRIADEPLKVVVVGGGSSGCATAYALIKAGHEVAVVGDGRGDAIEVGGMQHVGPNALKLLFEWDDVADELEEGGWTCHGVDYFLHDTEEHLGPQPFHPELVRDAGAPAVYYSHEFIHNLFRSAARKVGAVFIDGPVTAFDPETNILTLANGQTEQADLVVGADGPLSLIRRTLFPETERGAKKGELCTTAYVPREKLATVPGLEEVLDDDFVRTWLGENTYATAVPTADRSAWCIELHHPSRTYTNGHASTDKEFPLLSDPDLTSSWTKRPFPKDVKKLFSEYGPVMGGAVALADTGFTAAQYDLPFLEQHHYPHDSSDDDQVRKAPQQQHGAVLVGGAAHPIYPGSINGFSMAMEDAHVLGAVLSRYSPQRAHTGLPALLGAYSQIRVPRVDSIAASEKSVYAAVTLPRASAAALGRDEGIRQTAKADRYGGDAARESITATWAYNAGDEAENWWMLWRAPLERSSAAAGAQSVSVANVSDEE